MIREANRNNLEELEQLAYLMHKESVYSKLEYSAEKSRAEIEWLLSNGVFYIKEVEGKIVGGMSGYVRAPFFSYELIGYESAFYLLPEYRHGLIAAKLITAWSKWCIAHGALQLKPVTSCGVFGADRLYKALGFIQTGSTFIKDVA